MDLNMTNETDFSAERFFDLHGLPEGLVPESGQAWAALDGLHAYLKAAMKPNVRGIRIAGGPGTPVMAHTVVAARGEVLDGGFEVVSWEAAKGLLVVKCCGKILEGASVICAGAVLWDEEIEIGPCVLIEPGALIKGPAIIGPATEVRQAAYMRGDVVTCRGCVVGHATEVKSSIFLDGAKAGHFAYVGDSILGREANLGAGTKLANLKMIPGNVEIPVRGGRVDTGRRKLGAVLGDGTETGCNSVTSPGALLGKRCRLFPNATAAAGYYEDGTVVRGNSKRAGNR